jgi:hypothetical protein
MAQTGATSTRHVKCPLTWFLPDALFLACPYMSVDSSSVGVSTLVRMADRSLIRPSPPAGDA